MKKMITLLLAFVMVAAMVAGCGPKKNTETTEATTEPVETTEAVAVPASALEVLETVWALHGSKIEYTVVGGDAAYHAAQMEKDENYMMPSAPGKFNLDESEELIWKMLVPEAEVAKISDAATVTHMMNSNNFNCGVYRVSAADAETFIAAMKTAILENQWMCGMPESLLIATIADEFVLVAYGINDAMGPFETDFVSAYPAAELVVDEAIAG